jgi:hypothetical protein
MHVHGSNFSVLKNCVGGKKWTVYMMYTG